MRKKLKRIIETEETFLSRIFNYSIQLLIIISILSFSLETLPNLTPALINYLHIIELFSVIIFTIEYLCRLYIAENKLKYIFSVYGLIDLVAIMPFYLNFTIDLRSLRVVRLIRLAKLFRFNQSLILLRNAFIKIKKELLLFLFITFILIYISSVGIYLFENSSQPEAFKSIFHCFWWSVCTLTTVGYGDVYPITIGGKIFTTIISLIGIGIVAIPTGLFSSALTVLIKKDKNK